MIQTVIVVDFTVLVDCIGDEMVGLLASSDVDREFESDQRP
jgi:hypothetical protein